MTTQKKYFPQLDVIRGISLLSVFFFHAYHPSTNGVLWHDILVFFHSQMGKGLEVFFILSSFLLTYLGIKEYKSKGEFSLKRYFIRRILRIWPLYFFFIFLAFLIVPALASKYGYDVTLPPASYYLLFVSNFYMIDHVFFLRILWTLSIEEQFYLLWGFCLFFFQSKMKVVIAAIALASLAFNFHASLNSQSVYFNTLTYFIDMMTGAYIAYAIINDTAIVKLVHRIRTWHSLLFYLFIPILFTAYFFADQYFKGSNNFVVAMIINLIFVFYVGLVILHQMKNTDSSFSLKKYRWLAFTGKISYGMYCFHGLIITVGVFIFQKFSFQIMPFLQSLILLSVTYVAAMASYYFLEKPFLNLKLKFG